jgi:hypothetical protein
MFEKNEEILPEFVPYFVDESNGRKTLFMPHTNRKTLNDFDFSKLSSWSIHGYKKMKYTRK